MKRKSFIASVACAVVGILFKRKAQASPPITDEIVMPSREKWMEFLTFVESLGVAGDPVLWTRGKWASANKTIEYVIGHVEYLQGELRRERMGKESFKDMWRSQESTADYYRNQITEWEKCACQTCKSTIHQMQMERQKIANARYVA